MSDIQKRSYDKYPRAVFLRCASHCLNLVIIDQSKISIIKITGDIKIIRFFRKCFKRRVSLEINIPLFSPTRWSEKCKSIRIFVLLEQGSPTFLRPRATFWELIMVGAHLSQSPQNPGCHVRSIMYWQAVP